MKYNKGFTLIAIIAIITGALVIVGGVYYLGKNSKTVPQNTVEDNYQPQATSPQSGMLRYQSIHNFIIDYPKNWRYDSTIEKFESIKEAEKVGGNHFSIFSYPLDNSYNPGGEVPQNELKIETSIYGNVQGSLDQWINSFAIENTVLKTESILINGKNAKKVLYAGDGKIETRENDSPILIIFYFKYLSKNSTDRLMAWEKTTVKLWSPVSYK